MTEEQTEQQRALEAIGLHVRAYQPLLQRRPSAWGAPIDALVRAVRLRNLRRRSPALPCQTPQLAIDLAFGRAVVARGQALIELLLQVIPRHRLGTEHAEKNEGCRRGVHRVFSLVGVSCQYISCPIYTITKRSKKSTLVLRY